MKNPPSPLIILHGSFNRRKENSQEVYDTAYESVQLDMNVYFREDGIIYYFYPYEMGSYADGFRDIFISYKDLLGRDTLSE